MPYERSRRLLYGIQHQRKRGRRRILRGKQLPEQEKVMQAAMLEEGSIGHFERGLTEAFINLYLLMMKSSVRECE